MNQLSLFPDQRLQLWALSIILIFTGAIGGFFYAGAFGNHTTETHLVCEAPEIVPTEKGKKEFRRMLKREIAYEKYLRRRGLGT
jgi:hypothetical protein